MGLGEIFIHSYKVEKILYSLRLFNYIKQFYKTRPLLVSNESTN